MFTIREISIKDFNDNFFTLLNQLTTAPRLPFEKCRDIWVSNLQAKNHWTFVAVNAEDKVIGTASIIIEKKFIHSGRSVGHIEDLVVDHAYRSQGVGKALVEKLIDIAKREGCYKAILDCLPQLVNYYEKLGFKNTAVQMSQYF